MVLYRVLRLGAPLSVAVVITALYSAVSNSVWADEVRPKKIIESKIRGPIGEDEYLAYAPSRDEIRLRPSFASLLFPSIDGIMRPSLSGSLLRESRMANENYTAPGLRSSIIAVLRDSDELRAGLHSTNAAQLEIGIARAALLPTIVASASLNDSGLVSGSPSSTSYGSSLSSRIEVSVPIFSSGKNYYGLKSAKYAASAADYEYLVSEQQVAYEGILAYLEVYLDRKRESAIAKNVAALRRINIGLRARFRAGFIGKTDLAIASAELNEMQELLASAKARRQESESVFESQTNMRAPLRMRLPQAGKIAPASLQAALSRGLEGNATILAAYDTAEAARYQAKAVRGEFGPQISLTGNYENNQYFDYTSRNADSWKIGIKLSVPLVDFATVPSIQQSREKAFTSLYKARDTSRKVERRIRKSWIKYRSSLKLAKILKNKVRNLKVAAVGTNKEYNAGLRPLFDVLRAQMDLTDARVKLAENEVKTASAAYAMQIVSTKFNLASLAK